MTFAERTADLLANDNSAESRGDYRVAVKFAQFVGEPSTNFGSDLSILEKQRALKVLATVQPGAQHEVPIEQRACFSKEREQILVHQNLDLSPKYRLRPLDRWPHLDPSWQQLRFRCLRLSAKRGLAQSRGPAALV